MHRPPVVLVVLATLFALALAAPPTGAQPPRPAAGVRAPGVDGLAAAAEATVARLVEARGHSRIALVHPAGAAGRRVRDAVTVALLRRGHGLVAVAALDWPDELDGRAIAKLRPARPDALILVGPADPSPAAALADPDHGLTVARLPLPGA